MFRIGNQLDLSEVRCLHPRQIADEVTHSTQTGHIGPDGCTMYPHILNTYIDPLKQHTLSVPYIYINCITIALHYYRCFIYSTHVCTHTELHLILHIRIYPITIHTIVHKQHYMTHDTDTQLYICIIPYL